MLHARTDFDGIVDTRENPIPDDEPVFLIRGQDPIGWRAVQAYAGLAHLAGAKGELVDLCHAQARLMSRWLADHPRDRTAPDMPPGAARVGDEPAGVEVTLRFASENDAVSWVAAASVGVTDGLTGVDVIHDGQKSTILDVVVADDEGDPGE